METVLVMLVEHLVGLIQDLDLVVEHHQVLLTVDAVAEVTVALVEQVVSTQEMHRV